MTYRFLPFICVFAFSYHFMGEASDSINSFGFHNELMFEDTCHNDYENNECCDICNDYNAFDIVPANCCESDIYDFDACNDMDSYYGSCCDLDPDIWSLWPFDNYVFLGYTGGEGLSYRKGYTSGGIFLTPRCFEDRSFVPFFDAKGYLFNEGKMGANVGLGLRYWLSSWNMAVGVNAYYDYRNLAGNDYNQFGVGLELLGSWFDLRVNGYFPVGSYNYERKRLFDFGDDFFALRSEWNQAYKGVDGEIGAWILRKPPCDGFGLYFAIGPYYYERDYRRNLIDDDHRSIRGGRARLLARVTNYVDVSVKGTYDNIFHGKVAGQITLTLPLYSSLPPRSCCCKSIPCLSRQILTQPTERNGIIVVGEPDCTWKWNWSGACPVSGSCEECYSYSSYSDYCSGGYTECSWHSSEFSSSFFPYPYECVKYRSCRR